MTTDEAISVLNKINDLFGAEYENTNPMNAINMAIEALKREQWIPVSERLPDEFGWYIITHKDWDNSDIAFWEKYWLNGQGTVVKDVIAWKPLPEPYKENKE